MLNEQNIRRNLQAVDNAIAQQRLEGLEPSGALIADLQRVARGELPFRRVIENIKERVRAGRAVAPRAERAEDHAQIREPRSVSRS